MKNVYLCTAGGGFPHGSAPSGCSPKTPIPGGPALPIDRFLYIGPPRTGVEDLARTPDIAVICHAAMSSHAPFRAIENLHLFPEEGKLIPIKKLFHHSLYIRKPLLSILSKQNFIVHWPLFPQIYVTNNNFYPFLFTNCRLFWLYFFLLNEIRLWQRGSSQQPPMRFDSSYFMVKPSIMVTSQQKQYFVFNPSPFHVTILIPFYRKEHWHILFL